MSWVFDYEDGEYLMPMSDNMAMDSDGDLMMRVSDNTVMDLDSGELHMTSGWPDDDDRAEEDD